MTKEEQETTIGWDAATKTASIFTAAPAVIRKLGKPAALHPDTYRCTQEDTYNECSFYQVPVRCSHFGKPASEAQLEAERKNVSLARRAFPVEGF